MIENSLRMVLNFEAIIYHINCLVNPFLLHGGNCERENGCMHVDMIVKILLRKFKNICMKPQRVHSQH